MATPDTVSGCSSPLSSPPISPIDNPPSSPLSDFSRSPSPPPSWRLFTPPCSQDAGEEMPRSRKRRKIDTKERTTQHLDLTSDTAQSDYDRREALDTLLHALRKRRKIVVIAGAGISVSAGIPDFRSSHGLFRSLKGEHKLKSSGKQLFDASVYKDSTSTSQFHDMVRKLSKMSKEAKPTPFHHLLARLSTEGRLLRLYTQNVDGLETQISPLSTQVPLPHKGPWPQTVQLHGGLEKMNCQKCREILDFDAQLFEGPDTPICPKCREFDDFRTNDLGRRSHGVGRLRPRIVLYNEQNPDDEAIGAVSAADMRTRPDAIVVVGTSMKIPGVRRIVSEMCKIVRGRREGTTIWINPDPEPNGPLFEDCWDLIVKGTSDEVARLAKFRKWNDPIRDDPDLVTDCAESDTEKLASKMLPTPSKTQADRLRAAVMTPPRSQSGDVEETFRDVPSNTSPIRIKLTVKTNTDADGKTKRPPNVPKSIKNPASGGRKLVDVLGKENVSKSKSKTSYNKKANVQKSATQTAKQGKLTGKVRKATRPADIVIHKKEPLSPTRQSEINAQRNFEKSDDYSSVEVTSTPGSPTSIPASPLSYDRKETISPKGTIPSGMEKLLH